MFNLSKKVAIVTGGAAGIGLSISKLFSERGATVIILDCNQSLGSKAIAEIEQRGGRAEFMTCDVSDSSMVNDVIKKIISSFGQINILVNNAGLAHAGDLLSTSEEDFDRVYQVNVKGIFNCLRPVVSHMEQLGGGVVLNLASIASKIGISERFAYSMSKGACLTMTLSVAKDFVKKGIRCNCICPARIHTPIVDNFIRKNHPHEEEAIFKKLSNHQPIGRMGKTDEVAALALYLCSDEAGFVTGSSYDIDGGVINLI
jgi:NAD(P)-dependent dehydrogenase (short-subunit alcohol dehydrogenase family)